MTRERMALITGRTADLGALVVPLTLEVNGTVSSAPGLPVIVRAFPPDPGATAPHAGELALHRIRVGTPREVRTALLVRAGAGRIGVNRLPAAR